MTNRIPAIAVIVVCLAALVFVDGRNDRTGEFAAEPSPLSMPIASSAESLGSTWYCAAGLLGGDANENTIVITNPADEATGVMTIFAALPDGNGGTLGPAPEPIERPITLAPRSQQRLAMSNMLDAFGSDFTDAGEAFAGLLLEFSSPGIVVEHLQRTAAGSDASPCASRSASQWYFASGTTTSGVRELVAILNPFPTGAVVDITFVHDDGRRAPGKYDKLVVPPNSLAVLEASLENTVRAQSAMTIDVRSGSVVAERMQFFQNEAGPRGFTTALGVSEPGLQWFFPSGRALADSGESFVIFNPGEAEADVELLLRLDPNDISSSAQPFAFPVAAGERLVVTVDDAVNHPTGDQNVSFGDRIADGVPYWASVQSFNGVPVVVERVATSGDPARRGVTMAPGAPLASREQWLSLPVELGASSPEVAILNPANDTIARVSITAIKGDELVDVIDVEIAAGERVAADLSASFPVGTVALLIESSAPVVAEVTVETQLGAITSLGVPSADAIAAPRLILSY